MKHPLFLVAVVAVAILGTAFDVPLAKLKTYPVTCATTATSLAPTTGRADSMWIWNNSTTPVYLGGSDVDTSTKGMPICTDSSTCIDSRAPIDTRDGFCRVASGTVAVKILSGVR